jgi:hypothetical protein
MTQRLQQHHLVRFPEHVFQLVIDLRNPGSWLIDQRLLYKRLDVRIRDTIDPPFHKGRYEGHSGFTVLMKRPSDVAASNIVKMGFSENRLLFQIRHLVPETTTERPGFVTHEAAISITSAFNTRVVIIGPDLAGDTSRIGTYGYIVQCPYDLELDQACVQDLWNHVAYFHKDSLCRSHSENGVPVNWYGNMIY